MFILIQLLFLMFFTSCANGEFYEDRRCSCICPGLENSANKSRIARAFYQDNHISPEECNCNDMVLPRIMNKFNGSLLAYCLQCDCHFETRNTTVILIVVMTLIGIISVLMVYMGCLMVLHKMIRRRAKKIRRPGVEEQLSLLNEPSPDETSEEEN